MLSNIDNNKSRQSDRCSGLESMLYRNSIQQPERLDVEKLNSVNNERVKLKTTHNVVGRLQSNVRHYTVNFVESNGVN